MKRNVIIDGNNFGFAGMASAKLVSGETETQAVFSFLKRINSIYEEYPTALITVLWDGRSWRKDIYPEYKANREKTEEQVVARAAYKKQSALIKEALEYLGVLQVSASNMEADDLAAIMVKNIVASGNQIATLLTADQDWQQLVQKGVRWIDVIRDKTCTHNTFEKDTGFKDISQFVEAKCILGDAGDNIKGINGFGPKRLLDIYKIFPTFREFLEASDEEVLAKAYADLRWKRLPAYVTSVDKVEALAKLDKNMELVDLYSPKRPKAENTKHQRSILNKDGFEYFCAEYGMQSFLRNIDGYLQPFISNPYTLKVS